MWQSGLPRVTMAEAEPSRLMPRKVWDCAAALMALVAEAMDPSVPFLKPRGHLPVGLRLGGAGADGGPADQVGDVLRRDGIEQLGGRGQAEVEHVAQEGAGEPQAGGDVVRTVEVRIHHEALPADRRAGLLEINAHDDHHAVVHLAGQGGQPAGVVAARRDVMDGARADDQQEAPVVGENETVNFTPGAGDEFSLGLGLGQFREQRGGRGQGAGLDDIDVGCLLHERPDWGARAARIKSLLCAMNLGKEKAGRLPLSDRPLLS
jgi:hypothetical protein